MTTHGPDWFQASLNELGKHEDGDNRGPVVRSYIALAHAGHEGDQWCAIFANAMLEKTGHPGTRSAGSQSFRSSAHFVRLNGPALGALAVFWRGNKSAGLGHVGFYNGEQGGYIYVVGGNESDAVRNERYPRNSSHFGLVGYYWPAGIPLPTIGSLPPQSAAKTGSKVT